jgi:acetyl-CoA acyltransferase
MSEDKARRLGLTPLVRVVATATVGVEPCVMGTGPVPATHKALARAGMTLQDVDLIEINEAFAAQTLACVRMLGLSDEAVEDKLNVRGGAIAIGHPLGASGARIATTLIRTMIDRDANVGLATMCIGVGQGIATVFQRV